MIRRIFTNEHRKRLSESAKKRDKSTQVTPKTAFKKGCIPWNKGKKGCYSPERIEFQREVMKGNNFHYIDGRTPLVQIVRHCRHYIIWRDNIFNKDDFTCQECGKRGCYLEAHHLYPFSLIWGDNNITTYKKALSCEKLWDTSNGQTLCKECHNKTKKVKQSECKSY